MMDDDRWYRTVPLPSRRAGEALVHGPGSNVGKLRFEAERRERERLLEDMRRIRDEYRFQFGVYPPLRAFLDVTAYQ